VTPLTAQQWERELLRQIDSLIPLLGEAEVAAADARARREDAERRAAAPATDTLRVGPLRIVTLPGQHTQAERVYRGVWEGEYASFLAHSPSLDSVFFTFDWSATLSPIYIEGTVQRVEVRAWRPRSVVEHLVRQAVGSVLLLDVGGTALSRWSSANVRVPQEPEEIYRELALSASKAARACMEGDPDACWSALGLGHEADPYPLDEWYSPEERRALAGRRWPTRQQQPAWDDCVENGRTDRCDLYLAEVLDRHGIPASLAPLGSAPRAAMLWVALQTGGEGAWDRLREDPDASPGTALLHAAGTSRDRLARTWLAYVLDHRPPSWAGVGTSFLRALLWIAALGALAMRSTRWRLG
jgi:hypothetical protein